MASIISPHMVLLVGDLIKWKIKPTCISFRSASGVLLPGADTIAPIAKVRSKDSSKGGRRKTAPVAMTLYHMRILSVLARVCQLLDICSLYSPVRVGTSHFAMIGI